MPKKFKLPKGALQPKYWNVKPENLSAFYTFQSQRYFQSMVCEHIPECYEYFQVLVQFMEQDAEDNKFSGWKALAHQWCKMLNAMVFHDDERFEYHLEANEFIGSMHAENFGVYHRALNIAAFQMDHSSFREALTIWKDLRKEQAEDFKYFEVEDHRWEWTTQTKLVNSYTKETIAIVDDKYWLQLKPKAERDQIAMMSIPLLNTSSSIN